MMQVTLIFKGRVQGVGFRSFVVAEAEELGIKGTVQNLQDGSVKAVGEGEKELIEKWISAIKKGRIKIDSVTSSFSEKISGHTDFVII